MTHEEYDKRFDTANTDGLTHSMKKNTAKKCLTIEDAISHLSTLPKERILLGPEGYPIFISQWEIDELPGCEYVQIIEDDTDA